jgi:hypothetical protein
MIMMSHDVGFFLARDPHRKNRHLAIGILEHKYCSCSQVDHPHGYCVGLIST